MSPFKAIGEQARWRTIYDLLVVTDTGGIVTYDDMAAALDLDGVKDRHVIQMAMRRAAREHETIDKRAVEAVPNLGYRVVLPPEHMRLARQHQARSSKALVAGRSKVVNVDLNGLEPDVRQAFQIVAQAFAMQMDFNRRMDVRQQRLEETLNTIAERHGRSETEIAELRERLARLERREAS